MTTFIFAKSERTGFAVGWRWQASSLLRITGLKFHPHFGYCEATSSSRRQCHRESEHHLESIQQRAQAQIANLSETVQELTEKLELRSESDIILILVVVAAAIESIFALPIDTPSRVRLQRRFPCSLFHAIPSLCVENIAIVYVWDYPSGS